MTELRQSQSQLQQTADASLTEKMQFWLDKAVAWGQADSPDTRRDTCLHLTRLRDFLQQLVPHINSLSSTTETLKRMPFLGQLLGRLCWNPYVTVGYTSRGLLLQCLWGLYSEHPSSALERKANLWIRKVLCQLATEEDDAASALMKCMGVSAKEYHLKVLKKMVTRQQENIGKSCCARSSTSQRCSCDIVLATSEVCIPLLNCPEASPLVTSLLQQPLTCSRAALSEDFLDALSSSYSSRGLTLDEAALIPLWYHSLPALEEAVLRLLESVTNTESTPQQLQQHVAKSVLPKACAQHCSMFLVTNDIFRSILKRAEGSQPIRSVIQAFTSCFLRELAVLQPQTLASLKDFFPQSPQSLLVPLSIMPSEVPQEAWKNHLKWLSGSLERLIQEEEGDGDGSSTRGQHSVFEAWFLLVQCAHWVQAALQLLATSGPEDCGPLLWLLTFYHHPTNRWHHRALQLEKAKEAWDHLHTLCCGSVRPLPVQRLQSLVTLVSPQAQPTSPAPSLTFSLLVHFAAFCQLPLRDSVELLQTVVHQSGLRDEAANALSSLQFRLNEGSCSSSDTVHLRINELQNAITHIQAEPDTHTHTHTHTHKLHNR
ncbi:Fanconi anemia group C protein [Cololabis saira]|uniref:Fanconi anemia group C protein n=1 Tax=Cololabis saira TaxID=129043 RepID=UPI002AD1E0E0|nr:Fanconi anemia group C protein [Cololabis saira]